MRLANYIYKKNFLTEKECNKLIEEGQSNLNAGVVFKGIDLTVRDTNVSFFHKGSVVDDILQKIISEIVAMSLEMYGVYITDIEPIQYAEYKKGMFYSWHADSGLNNSQPVKRDVSVSLLLNSKDEYTGGSLQMVTPNCISKDDVFTPQDVEDQEQGTLVMFPSSMIHQVKPVISGVRKSLVLWSCSNIKPA